MELCNCCAAIIEGVLRFMSGRAGVNIDMAYFTAPKVRPRTSCFWLNQPMIRIGAMASVEAADSFAQNSPCGLENELMKAVSGAASVVVRRIVQNASFQARMMFKSIVEAMPGTAIGVSTYQISPQRDAPSMRAASRISPGISRK